MLLRLRQWGGLWKAPFINLVPMAIDTDGSRFDGVGYRDGYRLSASGGLSAQANTFTTGFIPVTAADVIRMAGVNYTAPEGQYCYLIFYDSAFSVLGSTSNAESSSYATGYRTLFRGIVVSNGKYNVNTNMNHPMVDANGVTVFDNYEFTDGSNVAYFRINGYGAGADAIVTINEEITL